jgi:glycosyltransferase involved in cell wall biosynthesis
VSDQLVSVIIPCFRKAEFLGSAVESVLAQSYSKVEVIVVNDGSDDNTEEVAASFSPRIKYISQANMGVSCARNTGIANSNGEYLHFLDADDLLHPEAISWLMEAARGKQRTIARIGWCEFNKGEVPRPSMQITPNSNVDLLPDLIHFNPSPPHGYLIPRSGITEVGSFDDSCWGCEDWDLWLRLALAGYAGVVVGKVGAYYRKYPGTLSTNSLRMLQARVLVLARAHDTILKTTSLFGRLAEELLAAERRVYRRCVLQKAGDNTIQMLSRCIEELIGRGVNPRSGTLRRIMTSIMGYSRSEAIVMLYVGLRDARSLDSYRESFW